MPLLVNKLIFTIVPQRTPFFIRPIANMIFAGLMSKMVDPRLAEHLAFVRFTSLLISSIPFIRFFQWDV